MPKLEFMIYKIPSEWGPWLAAFEGDELIFLDNYEASESLEEDLAAFFERHYGVELGDFTPAKWTRGHFWDTQHKIKLQGTDFQLQVWMELVKIPRGKTLTYTELAEKLNKANAVRAVASAVAKNPIAYWIPCHRVISSSANKVLPWKKKILQSEGAM